MKKIVSLLLCVMIICSCFSIFSVCGSAAILDDSKIYIKVGDKHYEVNQGDVFTYEYKLKYTEAKIGSIDVRINYPSSALKFVPDVDEYGEDDMLTMFPILGYAVVYNFDKTNEILFNYSSLSGVRFMKDDSTVFRGKFEVLTNVPGVYEIDGYLQTLADTSMNKIVYEAEVLGEFTESKAIPEITPIEDQSEPSLEESTVESDTSTQESIIVPTGPDGTAPTDPTPSTEGITDPTEETEDSSSTEESVPDEETQCSSEPVETEPSEDTTEETEESTEATEESSEETEESTETTEESSEETEESTEATEESSEQTESDPEIYIKANGKLHKVNTGDIFTYEVTLKYTQEKISSLDMRIPYDSTGLKFVPTLDEYGDVDLLTIFPVTGNATVYNFDKDGELLFNYSSIGGVSF
ncbi:MAG: hypothetical protein IKB73_05510, partial [Ruminococcus sp.]|nr:hypothetical protein [Ruminococcus sp.]